MCRVQPDVAALGRALDYLVPSSLAGDVRTGGIVRVPLHGRRVHGWVLDPDVERAETAPQLLQPLAALVSAGPPADLVALAQWAAWRFAGPIVTFLRAASPANVVPPGADPPLETAVYPEAPPTGRGADVAARMIEDVAGHPRALVVWPPVAPVDGLVRSLLASEGSTLVIDPDRGRASRLAAACRDDGREVVVVDGEAPDAERTASWARSRAGACVVFGGRAAVWAPVPDLAAVVVVDEADEALEDERAPTWHAREVAVERARRAGARVVMVTPAPTVEAVVTAELVCSPSPAFLREHWPRLEVVDPRDGAPGERLLSAPLADALHRALDGGSRAVCVLNRKGRARLLACATCGELARCDDCGAAVVEREEGLVCEQCGATRPLVCLACHGGRLRAVRPGIARVRESLAALLPRATVAAVDAQTTSVPDAAVLVGTEAVLHRAAGAGRPPVRLVAFLEFEQELLAPRVRAAEQALWLLVRAARLVGGRREGGLLLVQSTVPDHEVLRAVASGEVDPLVAEEEARRKRFGFPPFSGLAELSGDEPAVRAALDALGQPPGIVVLGPVVRGTRHAALVRAPSVDVLADALGTGPVHAAHARGRLRVDVDPRRL